MSNGGIKFRLTLKGTAPMLMHSARLSNPLDPSAKALKKITSKRIKTDEDHIEMMRIEFAGSMYYDKDAGPFVPGVNIHATLVSAGKKTRSGQKVKEGVLITSMVNPLMFKGPRTIEELWEDENFRSVDSVKVGTARVMRTRPMFQQWATDAEGILDPNTLSWEDFQDIVRVAGSVGLGDWRPIYGRFDGIAEKLDA